MIRPTHELSFVIRVQDHFSWEPVPEALDVRVVKGQPAARSSDGTYRWSNLADGAYQVTVTSPSARWTRWDSAAIPVVVPLATRATPVDVEMWPTPKHQPPLGITAIRGKLVGANVAKQRVEIDATAAPTPSGKWTLADASGELLFALPGGPWAMDVDGLLDLTVVVPGRTVTAVEVLPEAATAGARFFVAPDRVSRVRIHVT